MYPVRTQCCWAVEPLTVRAVLGSRFFFDLGRNGWYCLESDVAKWPELAGWRGLLDPAIQSYFMNRFWAFGVTGDDCDSGWGPQIALMANLGINFEIVCMGEKAEDTIAARLAAGTPSLFYLWEPHPLQKRYSLNRIQLPTFNKARYDEGKTDFPTDILSKAASAILPKLAPKVWQMFQRFVIDR